MKRLWVLVMLQVIVVIGASVYVAEAQARAAFTADRALIAAELDARSVAFVNFLETGMVESLTQRQFDEIEVWAIPASLSEREELTLRLRAKRGHDKMRLGNTVERMANESRIGELKAILAAAELSP